MISPTREEFLKLVPEGNLIPVSCRLLGDLETPLSAYEKIRGDHEAFLFESIEGGEHLGRYSFVGANPRAIVRQEGNRIEVIEGGRVVEKYAIPKTPNEKCDQCVRDGLEVIEKLLARYRVVEAPGLPRFTGGAVGFIGYEFIHDVEPVVPRPPADELGTPTMYFLIADQLLVFDRVGQTITVLVNAVIEDPARAEEAYDRAVAGIRGLCDRLEKPLRNRTLELPDALPETPFTSNMTPERFQANVERAKHYIHIGDIFQVVGSQRFSAPFKATPLDLYRAVRTINPSPYMFLLELDGFALVGASPEIHVRCENRRVEIRPIAGTRRRGKTEEEDKALERELLNDPKECAEHVMLVDLARNDIGRVCEYGSVHAEDLMIIERYSHVMHIVSQVEGRLAAGRTPYDLIRATFPAGTLSGAPKIRAMQIIAEMEQSTRGPYGGCVGYFSFNGNLDCCITIRTALVKDGKAHVQAGGGWVADSTPEGEFQETVNKSQAMRKACAMAEALAAADGR